MAKRFDELNETHIEFIREQQLFFVGTAGADGYVNVSPKGMDSLRVINPTKVVWLNLTGSGNETAAHVLENQRMTIMFCSFTEMPNILRLYGEAQVVHRRDTSWAELSGLFPEHSGQRQVFELAVQLVQTSCGFGVPMFEYLKERTTLEENLARKEEEGIEDYWRRKNALSINGVDTGILPQN